LIATILAILGLATAILTSISSSPSTVEHDRGPCTSEDEIIDDFVTTSSCDIDDLTNWVAGGQAGTPTNDLNDKKEGDASINMGKTGTASTEFYYDRIVSPAIDIHGELLVFWMYLERGIKAKLSGATVYVYDSGGLWHGWQILDSFERSWIPIVMGGWGTQNSDPMGDLTNVVKIRLHFTTNSASDTITVGDMKIDYWHYGRKFTITGGLETSPIDVFEEVYQHDKNNVLGICDKFRGSDDRKGDAIAAVTYLLRSPCIYVDTNAWGKAENIGILCLLPHGIYPYSVGGRAFVEAAELGHMRFGTVIDGASRQTAYGCTLYVNTYDTGIFRKVDLLSSSVQLSSYATMYGGKIWNCMIYKMGLLGSGFDVFNVIFSHIYAPNHAAINHQMSGSFEKIWFISCRNAIHTYRSVAMTIKDVTAIGCTYLVRFQETALENKHFINFDVDSWTFNCLGNAETYTGKLFREYELDLTVEDRATKVAIEDAIVTLWDKNDNQVFQATTNADGKITTQTVKHGYFDLAHGSKEQLYSPFHLRIERAGYDAYDDYNLALDEKTGLKITLRARGVGGIAVPIDKFALLFPYLALAMAVVAITVAAIYVKRRWSEKAADLRFPLKIHSLVKK